MRKFFFIFIVIAVAGAGLYWAAPALAQGRAGDLGSALSRLKNNPRYDGRVLGTHIVQRRGRSLYEVRILRRDDQIILVYIDPQTGGVVGDSQRRRVEQPRRRDGVGVNSGRDRRPVRRRGPKRR